MARTAVSSDQAPDALGPYSQAIVAGGMVFCSGMAGIDPATGAVADGIEAQTDQALRNLAAVLSAAGASMDDVVKTTIFYANVEDFGRLNEVYARHMPDPPPARSAPANVRLPRGLLVSIEAIAVLPTRRRSARSATASRRCLRRSCWPASRRRPAGATTSGTSSPSESRAR